MAKYHKLNAIIVKSGRVISTGRNTIQDTFFFNVQKYSKELWDINKCAEKNAILKALKMFDGLRHLAGATIYVTRFGTGGETKLAKPCVHCHEFIKTVGIKRIVYTNNENGTTTEILR